ncbi:uncharacterized protein LKV04_009453 [Tautogolabrus adspersus]
MSIANKPARTNLLPLQRTETGTVKQRITGSSAIDLSSATDLRVQSKIRPLKSKTSSDKLFPSYEEYQGWRIRNPQILGSSATGKKTFSKSINVQPVHGRVDWSAKYGGHQ